MCRIEAAQLGTRHCPSKNSTGAGGVETVLVVAGRNRFRDFGFDLHAEVVSKHKVFSALASGFGQSESGRQHGNRRMNQKPVNAVLGRRELRVVEIIDVNRHTIRQCGKPKRQLERCADHRTAASRAGELVSIALD